jgi:hypothetical protein
METFSVQVGVSMQRPIVPDQDIAFVIVATDKGPNDAQLAAAQMVGATRGVMVTSTKIVGVAI